MQVDPSRLFSVQIRLVIELIWPLFLFFILVGVRSTNKPIYKGQCKYTQAIGVKSFLSRSSEYPCEPKHVTANEVCVRVFQLFWLHEHRGDPCYFFICCCHTTLSTFRAVDTLEKSRRPPKWCPAVFVLLKACWGYM